MNRKRLGNRPRLTRLSDRETLDSSAELSWKECTQSFAGCPVWGALETAFSIRVQPMIDIACSHPRADGRR